MIDWSAAHRARRGETESGDRHIVKVTGGHTLVAVVDGLGHGAEASRAAQLATDTLEARADLDITVLLQHCHAVMKSTRGAVAGLAAFNAGQTGMQWLSVGNVEGIVFRARPGGDRPPVERLTGLGGIVGYRLPRLIVSTIPIARSDVVVLATDGIHASFADRLDTDGPPHLLARRILDQYGLEADDALVLVLRYLGDVL